MAKRIFSLTAVCLLGFMLLPAGNKSTQTLSASDAPAREATSGERPDERLLFPELTDSDIFHAARPADGGLLHPLRGF